MSAWPWPSSESTAKIIPAFVGALQAVEDITRNKKANLELKTGANVRYNYADLDAVLEQVKPVLFAAGLAITQAAQNAGVQTVIMHTSGEWLSFPPLEVKTGQATPQAQGSALTYARRYQVLAALNVATEDDDGKAAGVPPREPTKTAARREAEKLFDEIRQFDDAGKAALKDWANGRKVSANEFEADADWREQVESWIDERKAAA